MKVCLFFVWWDGVFKYGVLFFKLRMVGRFVLVLWGRMVYLFMIFLIWVGLVWLLGVGWGLVWY